MSNFKQGMTDGIPIALGYLSVSFTFGIVGALDGFTWWQVVLISMSNLTSAGQFAGLGIMAAGGSLVEMALTQLVINLRYSLMAISLTQNLDRKFTGIWRWILGFGITDEIFGVAVSRPKRVTRSYMAGLIVVPYWGWALGTLLGVVLGSVLPAVVVTSLGVAIYGMFIAIVVPECKKDVYILYAVAIAVGLSCLLKYVPVFSFISSGFAIIICAVVASAIAAVLFPVADSEEEVEE